MSYNGWSNYETWRVVTDFADDYINTLIESGEVFGSTEDLAANVKEATMDEIKEDSTWGVAENFALAFIDGVDWQEIADAAVGDNPGLIEGEDEEEDIPLKCMVCGRDLSSSDDSGLCPRCYDRIDEYNYQITGERVTFGNADDLFREYLNVLMGDAPELTAEELETIFRKHGCTYGTEYQYNNEHIDPEIANFWYEVINGERK